MDSMDVQEDLIRWLNHNHRIHPTPVSLEQVILKKSEFEPYVLHGIIISFLRILHCLVVFFTIMRLEIETTRIFGTRIFRQNNILEGKSNKFI